MLQDGAYAAGRLESYWREGAESGECVEVMGPLCLGGGGSMGLLRARETGLGCEEKGAVQEGKQVGVPPPTR